MAIGSNVRVKCRGGPRMSSERARRIEAIYRQAVIRPPRERSAYLADACAGDDDLLREVESLWGAASLTATDEPSTPVIGTLIGHYHILDWLGAGGMGEVYRARDTKLGREVAIKVLRHAFTSNPERLARLEREARVLASLNHPHIGAIYGLEDGAGVRALVLELIDGQTLGDRVRRGPVPLKETLTIAGQLVAALDAAHERGIVHRDFKPANIKITPEGVVKVLDFGIAKASGEAASGEASHAPTAGRTREGMIIGTPAYMSPEQARGQPVDKRADIWAFGCVLYEMLTGRPAFTGDTASDIIAAILGGTPDWDRLPADTPTHIRELLARCLETDPRRRLRDIGDAYLLGTRTHAFDTTPQRRIRPAIAASAVTGVMALLAGTALWQWTAGRTDRQPAVLHLVAPLSQGEELVPTTVAVSSDGSRLAFVATGDNGSHLNVRTLSDPSARQLAGTSNASFPFFSPNGEWLGFFADGKLKKIAVQGGPAIPLADAQAVAPGNWASDGYIYYAPQLISGLWRVRSEGGAPAAVTTLDREKGEISHREPQFIAQSNALLFTVHRGSARGQQQIELHTLSTGRRQVVVTRAHAGTMTAVGRLVYLTDGAELQAIRFNGSEGGTSDGAPQTFFTNVTSYALSGGGLLAYVTGNPEERLQMVWVDRAGKTDPVAAPPRPYRHPRLSPDGRFVALQISEGPSIGIWIHDLERSSQMLLTNEQGGSQRPLWTPDGKRLTYRGTRDGYRNLFARPIDGSVPEVRLTVSGEWETPGSWSPDGQTLVFVREGQGTSSDIWRRSVDGTVTPVLQTTFNEHRPRLSPNGAWLAYESNESGRPEIYVRAFPGPGAKWQISNTGGESPVWSRDGQQLFYRENDEMLEVDASLAPAFTASKPRPLFKGRFERSADVNYDVTSDGRRFLMLVQAAPQASASELHVVSNWFEELTKDGKTK